MNYTYHYISSTIFKPSVNSYNITSLTLVGQDACKGLFPASSPEKVTTSMQPCFTINYENLSNLGTNKVNKLTYS
ncbi:hypothetical protein KY290_021633 [Solanum tuberosum]|uniref:Uncharacterized protein n=1 Tax=Solanum tuberosum TaxID=4113 RepID=A0ABQ7V592_SOLTU|nr:hypothetical protein KY289_020803 [Solanum tuberosum]KAH0758140.1 hypothetical protein KY290_021633 [Solanum tuberosum]